MLSKSWRVIGVPVLMGIVGIFGLYLVIKIMGPLRPVREYEFVPLQERVAKLEARMDLLESSEKRK